ncbi:type II toxin-antitoxin system RelE/ParE family toxin [Candidatus Daviesbacteria bacterium]|nr:type II toxin-antitoxin system RelE/ParE family toxin [Candidatus Daviesbacteria bacterium]
MFDYQFTKSSFKHFRKLPKEIQQRIIEKLDFFCSQQNPIEFAETLNNIQMGKYRFRIGNYRVAFDVEDKNLVIHIVDHRKDIYR